MGSWDIFFLSPSLPPPPYGRLSYVGFIVGVLKKDRDRLLLFIGEEGGQKTMECPTLFSATPIPPSPPPNFLFRSVAAK